MGGSAVQGSLRDSAPDGVRLIETMLWEPGVGVRLAPFHWARLAAGCAALCIARAPGAAEALVAAVSGDAPKRLRLTVGLGGAAELTEAPLPPAKALWQVAIAEARVAASDPWRSVKSTHRALYDNARAALPEGVDELIFLNENDDLAEGTITNVFVPEGAVLLTPPLAAGALPGVLRASLIAAGRAREARLAPEDLRGGFYLGNALRGLIRAELR